MEYLKNIFQKKYCGVWSTTWIVEKSLTKDVNGYPGSRDPNLLPEPG